MLQTKSEQFFLNRWIPLKLLLALLLILGIGGGVGLTLDNMVIRDQEKTYNQQQALQTSLAAVALSERLHNIAATSKAMARYALKCFLQGQISEESIHKLFKIQQKGIESIAYIGLYSSPSAAIINSDPSTPVSIQAGRQAAKWTGKYFSALSGMPEGFLTPKPVITGDLRLGGMLVPIWSEKEFLGVLTVIIDFGQLADKYMNPLRIGKFGSGFIVDGAGMVLFDQEKEILGQNIFSLHKNFPNLIKLDSRMLNDRSGTGEYEFYTRRGGSKVRKLIAWNTVEMGELKLVVAVSAPESEATETMTSIRTARIAMVAFMGFTIFGVIFFFYYYRSKQILISQNKELKRKDDLFEAIAMNVPGIIYKSELTPPFTLDYISPKINRLTGYDQYDFIYGGRSRFNELIHPEDRHKVRTAIEAAVAEKKPFSVEYRILRNDGKHRWVYERGNRLSDEDSIVGFIVDISERREEAQALHTAQEKYRQIVDNAPLGIYQSTPEGKFISVNPQMARYYGYSSPEDMIREIYDISSQCYVSTDTRKRLSTILKEFGRTANFEAEHRCRDGSSFWAAETINAVEDDAGNVIRYDGFMVDISERKGHEETMRRLAMYDSLTGLPNRVLFDDRIKQAISHAERSGMMIAVLYADLDNFKPVNDELGHIAGDTVLREVAGRFSDCLRTSDTVSRIGGDEFIFILQDIGSKNEIDVVAQRIIDTMRSPFYLAEKVYRLGVSIGISIYPDDSEEKEVLVRLADDAMYKAKAGGKNNFSYGPEKKN
ncbi:diguanylate cyclase domain-containing protein [Maridesulfovibrio sp.]|uniref:diguanylate cyclase domain-containing protein n=1 Tax=Maridesulfovibrio sp. TaxID=2795000 RepID=UPI002A18A179|nr:diguanylate cyclase [Maridesulfovibrio sp.]